MKAVLAKLISDRFESLVFAWQDDNEQRDKAYLVRKIYPSIAQGAYKGLTTATIDGIMTDGARKILTNDGYVVRHERGNVYTTIEWGMQTIIDEEGNPRYIAPEVYNNIRKDYIEGKSLSKYDLGVPFPIE
jgi:hypothetical protein